MDTRALDQHLSEDHPSENDSEYEHETQDDADRDTSNAPLLAASAFQAPAKKWAGLLGFLKFILIDPNVFKSTSFRSIEPLLLAVLFVLHARFLFSRF